MLGTLTVLLAHVPGDHQGLPKEFFVASDDLKMRQRNALAAQTMSAAQQSATQLSGIPEDSRERQRVSHAASMLALQSQIAQISQARSANATQEETSVEVV